MFNDMHLYSPWCSEVWVGIGKAWAVALGEGRDCYDLGDPILFPLMSSFFVRQHILSMNSVIHVHEKRASPLNFHPRVALPR
jgi:hypothetical protein